VGKVAVSVAVGVAVRWRRAVGRPLLEEEQALAKKGAKSE
jgi:hypothetical protein